MARRNSKRSGGSSDGKKLSGTEKHLVAEDVDPTEVQVLWEDQQKINKFGRLNNKATELRARIEQKTEQIKTLDEALTEAESTLDDVFVRVGSIFAQMDSEDAQAFVEKKLESAKLQVETLSGQERELQRDMDDLRVSLKAKFGDSINLDPHLDS